MKYTYIVFVCLVVVGGWFSYNSQMVKKNGAILTSGCDTRPWSLLDIMNTSGLVDFRLLLAIDEK